MNEHLTDQEPLIGLTHGKYGSQENWSLVEETSIVEIKNDIESYTNTNDDNDSQLLFCNMCVDDIFKGDEDYYTNLQCLLDPTKRSISVDICRKCWGRQTAVFEKKLFQQSILCSLLGHPQMSILQHEGDKMNLLDRNANWGDIGIRNLFNLQAIVERD